MASLTLSQKKKPEKEKMPQYLSIISRFRSRASRGGCFNWSVERRKKRETANQACLTSIQGSGLMIYFSTYENYLSGTS